MAGIELRTATGLRIENEQHAEREDGELEAFLVGFQKKWAPVACEILPHHMLRYNCHGLTFASRRTWIEDGKTVPWILEQDGYTSIPDGDVLPGDIVVYFGPSGSADHSGVVVEGPVRGTNLLPMPKVLSRWARAFEVIHWANQCPYVEALKCIIKYYRLTNPTVSVE